MISRVAAVGATILLVCVAVFQVALVLGAPWGEYTQGGANPGVLPGAARAVALVSAVLLLVMAGAVLARVGIGPMARMPSIVITALVWFTLFYSVLGVVLNTITPSAKERLVWAPVTALIAVLVLMAVIGSRGGLTLAEASRSGDRG